MSRSGFSYRGGDERGQVIVFVLVAFVVLLGMCAMVVDLGYLYWNQRDLQASADAAALAGAMALPDAATSENVAKQYGTGSTAKNHDSRVSDVAETVTAKCIATIPGCDPVNAVQVDETATVNTFFMRIFGLNQAHVHVRATACSPCGARSLDIMLVLDRTGSMCEDNNDQPDPACTDLNNAKNGIRTFLGYFDPSIDWVGLAVLPPASTLASKCSKPSGGEYNSRSSPYTLVPLAKDYKLANGSLNNASNLLTTLACVQGGGSTAYANAVEAAQVELDAHGRPDAQDIIVFLSDGAANTGPTYYPTLSPYRRQPCHQGITSAGLSKAKGTIVYSIGYAVGGDTRGCFWGDQNKPEPPTPTITAQAALQGMATDPAHFYNQPDPGQLNTIYTDIAKDIGKGTSALTADG
jgi:hypothetical protein